MSESLEVGMDDVGLDTEIDLGNVPRPPRRARSVTLALMAITVVVAGFLAWQLRGEALYALNDGAAQELGALSEVPLSADQNNIFARARVALKPAPQVRFRRLVDGDEYHVALAGEVGGARRWVAYRVPKALAGPRFVAPNLVAGRLTQVSDLGARYGGLRGALEQASGGAEDQSWVLVDGQDPRGAGWQFGLLLMLLGLVGWNVIAGLRIVRRAPAE